LSADLNFDQVDSFGASSAASGCLLSAGFFSSGVAGVGAGAGGGVAVVEAWEVALAADSVSVNLTCSDIVLFVSSEVFELGIVVGAGVGVGCIVLSAFETFFGGFGVDGGRGECLVRIGVVVVETVVAAVAVTLALATVAAAAEVRVGCVVVVGVAVVGGKDIAPALEVSV
jgi:hypothetical protein